MEMTARLVGYMMRTALQSSRKLEGGRAPLAEAAAPSQPSQPRWGLPLRPRHPGLARVRDAPGRQDRFCSKNGLLQQR